jgi:single-strand DNA-binding protein
MNETQITITGNLVGAPELRYTQTGQPVISCRVALTPRYQDRQGQWKDGDTLFLSVTAWRPLAENAAESLAKGSRVIVTGRLRQRTYETPEGAKRTVHEITADDIAPSLRTATAKVTRTSRTSGASGAADDPWSRDQAGGVPPV